MKKIMIAVVAALLLTSCGNNQVQTMKADGSVGWVDNDVKLDVNVGDTIVVYHSLIGYYSSSDVHGVYKGVVPKSDEHWTTISGDSVYVITYYSAEVVIKK